MKGTPIAVLSALATAAFAQQWNWREHAYPEDGFRAEFNAPVKIERMRLTGDGADRIVRGTKYMLDEGNRVYIVAASHCFDGTYRAEARYHQVGLWFYQVVALYKDQGGDAGSARYFVQSFRVI